MGKEPRVITAELLENLGEDQKRQLRRRIEDTLRKQPNVLIKVALMLANDKSIKVSDLIP